MQLGDMNKIVALARIESIDPSTSVGGSCIGANFVSVYVEVAIVEEEMLIRPYGKYENLSDAVGNIIAWPKMLTTQRYKQSTSYIITIHLIYIKLHV